MREELLLTGATGFIGSSLLEKWLDCTDAQITLLVRAKRGQKPEQRIDSLREHLGVGRDASALSRRIAVVAGDLSRRRLGLAAADYERLTAGITHIVHCGAAARFDLQLEDARRTNRGGAQSVIDLAACCQNLERLDYIGTAYVAGKRRGLILEEELDEGQDHNNSYERSKLEAEKLVRQAGARLPIAIFRPTIVLGDSRSGRVSPVSAFFRVLKMYARGLLTAVPGDPSTTMDLVSLDYTADAMFAIAKDPLTVGKCFHLSAGLDNLTTLEEIADLASLHFGRERFAMVPANEFLRRAAALAGQASDETREMMNELKLYSAYLAGDWRFDDSNTRRALEGTGLGVPRVGSYFGRMVAYVREHGGESGKE